MKWRKAYIKKIVPENWKKLENAINELKEKKITKRINNMFYEIKNKTCKHELKEFGLCWNDKCRHKFKDCVYPKIKLENLKKK
jgi:hypothetical protein